MKPKDFEHSNKTLTAPEGMSEEECKNLRVYTDGHQCISCWELSDDEIQHIVHNKKVWLGVLTGETQPPVFLTAESPFGGEDASKNTTEPFRYTSRNNDASGGARGVKEVRKSFKIRFFDRLKILFGKKITLRALAYQQYHSRLDLFVDVDGMDQDSAISSQHYKGAELPIK